MPDVKTLKRGDLYIAKGGGSGGALWAESVFDVEGVFVDGSYVTLSTLSGDVTRKADGNHWLTVDPSASSTVEINLTHTVTTLATLVTTSVIHLWFAYDAAGGSAEDVYYTYSTDDGATWAAESLVWANTAESWSSSYLRVAGAALNPDDASEVFLWVVGYNGSLFQLARLDIDASGGSYTTELANTANYTPNASNPLTRLGGDRARVCYGQGKYHLWYSHGTPEHIHYRASADGLDWWGEAHPNADNGRYALYRGVSGLFDDTTIRPTGATYHKGFFYLWYRGYDGTTNRPGVAVGTNPERLVKVGNLSSPTSGARYLYYANGDLSYSVPNIVSHIPDRAAPGALREGNFQPWNGSASFKQQFIGPSGVVASSDHSDQQALWGYAMLPAPSVREGNGKAITAEVSRCNLFYLDYDASGNRQAFYLFCDCMVTADVQEGEEGNDVTFNFTVHGAKYPLIGRY